jgi:hypothetical protein
MGESKSMTLRLLAYFISYKRLQESGFRTYFPRFLTPLHKKINETVR